MSEKTKGETAEEIYSKFLSLINKVSHSSPLLSNLGIGVSTQSKFMSLQIMQNYTMEKSRLLFDTMKKERDTSIYLKNTTECHRECTAFFEAYLNAFYSFFQMIAKVTPYFYDKKTKANRIPDRYFAVQMKHLIDNPAIDIQYANYLKNNMDWYVELELNRHAISHNVAAFLGFGKEEVEFIHMRKRQIDFFKHGKPTKKIEKYIVANWNSLFSFLKFYVDHFSNRKIFVDKAKELEKVRKHLQ